MRRVQNDPTAIEVLLEDLAAYTRDLHDKARSLFLVASLYMKESESRPERKPIADAWFEAAMALKREADGLGAFIQSHAKARRVPQFQA